MIMMTRKDDEVGVGEFDSIAWLFGVHINEPDNPAIKSALVYGSESSPERVDLYTQEEPWVTDDPVRTWHPQDDEEKMFAFRVSVD
jgi:hypothetical protein